MDSSAMAAVDKKKWYAVHVLSGQEKKVKAYLDNEISNSDFGKKIDDVLVPSEEIVEMRDGKKRIKNKVFFPGYILVRLGKTKDILEFIRCHTVKRFLIHIFFIGEGFRKCKHYLHFAIKFQINII